MRQIRDDIHVTAERYVEKPRGKASPRAVLPRVVAPVDDAPRGGYRYLPWSIIMDFASRAFPWCVAWQQQNRGIGPFLGTTLTRRATFKFRLGKLIVVCAMRYQFLRTLLLLLLVLLKTTDSI